MVYELKLRKIGNSVGLVLPKELLITLELVEGDTVVITQGTDNTVRLGPAISGFTQQLEAAQDVIRRYRNALHELAK